jgi:hypothetical protein
LLVTEKWLQAKALRRELANLSNQLPKRKRLKHAKDSDDTEITADSEVRAVALLGRQFVIMNLVWFRPTSGPFGCKVDEEYNPAQRFENDKSKLQGQLGDFADFLPKKFHDQYSKEWFTQTVSATRLSINRIPDIHFLLTVSGFYDAAEVKHSDKGPQNSWAKYFWLQSWRPG